MMGALAFLMILISSGIPPRSEAPMPSTFTERGEGGGGEGGGVVYGVIRGEGEIWVAYKGG